MKKTPEEKYIEKLKEKALLHTVNFEGDMIVGKEQLAKMFKEYATQCQQDNAEHTRKLLLDFANELNETAGCALNSDGFEEFVDEYLTLKK